MASRIIPCEVCSGLVNLRRQGGSAIAPQQRSKTHLVPSSTVLPIMTGILEYVPRTILSLGLKSSQLPFQSPSKTGYQGNHPLTGERSERDLVARIKSASGILRRQARRRALEGGPYSC